MKKTGREVNDILTYLRNKMPNKSNSITITKEMIYADTQGILKGLIGYIVSFDAKGEHTDINKMIPYKWTFTNPNEKKVTIDTETSLMLGWDLPKAKVFDI